MTTQEQVKDVVSQVLADKADKGGIKRVVWIGAGGSNGGNYPAQYFMEHEATQVVSSSYTSNEFVHATPAYVNENTLAVVVSMRGTKETIVAAQVAKDHGASTIAIYVDESGLTEVCDYKIQYDSLAVDESCMGRTNSAVVTMIAMELTQQTEGYAEYETAMAAFDLVDPIYRKAVEYARPLAAKWAEQNADKPCINVMAQGPLFGAAYVFSICNVQEMLQIDTTNILFICGGAFVGLENIIEQRVGKKTMGFGAEVKTRAERNLGELYSQILPEDLLKFGLIPEFIGRVPMVVTLEALDENALVNILTKPKNALLKQYQKLFAMDGIRLTFEEDAIREIAKLALERKTGARGLRSILEGIMVDAMYEAPSRKDIAECIVTKAAVRDSKELKLIPREAPAALPEAGK